MKTKNFKLLICTLLETNYICFGLEVNYHLFDQYFDMEDYNAQNVVTLYVYNSYSNNYKVIYFTYNVLEQGPDV